MRTTSHFFPKLDHLDDPHRPDRKLGLEPSTAANTTAASLGLPRPLGGDHHLSHTPLAPPLASVTSHQLPSQFNPGIAPPVHPHLGNGFDSQLVASTTAPLASIWNRAPPDPRDSLGASPLWLDDGEFDLHLDLSMVDDDDPVLTVSFDYSSQPPPMEKSLKPNIYSCKVNTPAFVPDPVVHLSDPFCSESVSATSSRTLPFPLPQVPPPPPQQQQSIPHPSHRIILKLVDHDVGTKFTSLTTPINSACQDTPTPLKYLDPHPIPKVLLPKAIGPSTVKLPDFDHLVMTLKNGELYLEDYCLTFYKRNDHGYMFIREPTTLLKVNFTGSRQWVQVKVKMPGVSKKTKVNIKNLPVWKPLSLNPMVNKRKDKRRRWKRFQLV